jgi:hypothetical protein
MLTIQIAIFHIVSREQFRRITMNRLPYALVVFFAVCLLGGAAVFADEQPVTTPDDDLAELSDEFDDAATLADWLTLTESEGAWDMLKAADIDTTSAGHLMIEPDTSGWYAEFHGVYLYKEVTGDFVVTTKLWAKGKDADIPTQEWSLAGLMARTARTDTSETWQPMQENWVFITTGIAAELEQPVFETKTTINSISTLRLHPTQAGWVELALARIDAHFLLLSRNEGKAWKIRERFTREDMPATLQVGLDAYTDWFSRDTDDPVTFNNVPVVDGEPDLIVLVDFIRFQRPALPADFDPAAMRKMKESDLIAAVFGE